MKTAFRASMILICMALASVAENQSSRFVGTWESRKSPLTGRSNITVIVRSEGTGIGGKLRFVNPDHSEMEQPILHAIVQDDTLRFNTKDDGSTVFSWSLEVHRDAAHGVLKGTDNHEMVIEEKVQKRRE